MDHQDPNTLESGISRSVEASYTGHIVEGDIETALCLGLLFQPSPQCRVSSIPDNEGADPQTEIMPVFSDQKWPSVLGGKKKGFQDEHSQNPPNVFL